MHTAKDARAESDVRRWPLRSGVRQCHWTLAVAVEVRQCPLQSGAGEEEQGEEEEEEEEKEEEEAKSSDKI
eukprot:s708_g37.t1